MKIVIINYNAGNIRSVDYALKRLGINAIITDNKEEILSADKIIFPGVGEAGTTMNYLRGNNMDSLIRELKQPVLGICMGMHVLCNYLEEGNTYGLGIFNTDVKRFIPPQHEYKVPHMGWNTLMNVRGTLFEGFEKEEFVYFVHSFYVPVNEYTVATTGYILPFSAAMHKDNFYCTQFHPEKSGGVGERILRNFIGNQKTRE